MGGKLRTGVSLAAVVACASGCAAWNPQADAPPRAQTMRPPVASGATLPQDYLAGLTGSPQHPAEKTAVGTGSSLPGAPPASSDQRAGSVMSPAPATTAVPPGVDPKAFNEVIAQLESIGAIDPVKQARLMEDLKQTDPSLWPLMLDAFRASLAYHERIAAKSAGDDASVPAVVDPPLLAKDGTPLRAAAAQGRLSPLSDRPKVDLGTWSALNLPPMAAKVAAQSQTNPERDAAAAIAHPAGNNAPLAEPGKLAAVDSQAGASALRDASAAIQRTGSVTPAAEATAPTSQNTPSNATLVVHAAAQTAGAGVQQASYQPKLADDDFEGHLKAAIHALEAKTQKPPAGPDEVAAHAYLRMLYLTAGRREDALRPIAGIDPAEQEFWSKQLWSLATYLDDERSADAPRRAAEAAQHLSAAASKLGEMATLVVRNLTFCSEVRSYGVFTRVKDNEFTPGQRVLLYAEVENFRSDHTRKGYHTALKCSYQILDAQGRRVAGDDSSAMEEYCQNPRRDYFLSYEHLQLPSPMYDGRYTLQLTIEDTLSQKIGQSSIEFTVKSK